MIEFCNIILLNKASEVEPSELERLKEIIVALQPHATIIECDYEKCDLDKIINTHLFDFRIKVATSALDWRNREHHHDDEHDDGDEDTNMTTKDTTIMNMSMSMKKDIIITTNMITKIGEVEEY